MVDEAREIQATTASLVEYLLEKKRNGSFAELLGELRPSLPDIAVLLHPHGFNISLLKEEVEKHFVKIPGSYRISMFLSCLKETGELQNFNVTLPRKTVCIRDDLFPPIVLAKDAMDESRTLPIIGKAVKAVLGDGSDNVGDEEVGSGILEAWESDAINAVFIELGELRPVAKTGLQTTDYWKRRGYILARPSIDREWFGEDDISFQHGILFPIRLLKGNMSVASSIAAHAEEERHENHSLITEKSPSLSTTSKEEAAVEGVSGEDGTEEKVSTLDGSLQTLNQLSDCPKAAGQNKIEINVKPGNKSETTERDFDRVDGSECWDSEIPAQPSTAQSSVAAGSGAPLSQSHSEEPIPVINYLEGVNVLEWDSDF